MKCSCYNNFGLYSTLYTCNEHGCKLNGTTVAVVPIVCHFMQKPAVVRIYQGLYHGMVDSEITVYVQKQPFTCDGTQIHHRKYHL